MDSQQIRDRFLAYFRQHQHEVVPSSPLIPAKDPTLLFTNAGMVPFKEVFLGQEKRSSSRATSIQKCVRAGGKHNDLEQVGFTTRHHTFFEMMGNFSFGDYFKKTAIELAWNFLTKELALDESKLWITVHHSDDEAFGIWTDSMGLPPERIIRLGDADNFWQMADTGPCGPCTEIFYDHGEQVSGGLPGSPDQDGDRYVEIWNVVFMQYDRDDQGVLHPLPQPSVDTGMGLERIAAVMQGVCSNYDTVDFQVLMNAIQAAAGEHVLGVHAKQLMADHLRSACFLIADQIRPSNEGRGYVLRRIIRRAVRFAVQAGVDQAFLFKVVNTIVDLMGQAYPELSNEQAVIEGVIKREEQAFLKTVNAGMVHLDKAIKSLRGKPLSGEVMFQLYDTFGFPADLTAMVAKERGIECDHEGFQAALALQKERSRASGVFKGATAMTLVTNKPTVYCGEGALSVSAVVLEVVPIEGVASECWVVLDRTVCYAEGGGQIADEGIITSDDLVGSIIDVQKQNGVFLHRVVVKEGEITVGSGVTVGVTSDRMATRAHHTATHLLHAALREVLGHHVIQKGSWVGPERLRFDFAHHQRMSQEECEAVTLWVNHAIRANDEVLIQEMAKDQAASLGAMALFDEKYDDTVRVVAVKDRSIELCGGSHVQRTGDIGVFVLIQEKGIASGIRRIEAAVGAQGLAYLNECRAELESLAAAMKCTREALPGRLEQLKAQHKASSSQHSSTKNDVNELLDGIKQVGQWRYLATDCKGPAKSLRGLMDAIKASPNAPDVAVLWVDGEPSPVVCGSIQKTLSARDMLNGLSEVLGGKGGGREDFAQGQLVSSSQIAINEWLVTWLKQQQ